MKKKIKKKIKNKSKLVIHSINNQLIDLELNSIKSVIQLNKIILSYLKRKKKKKKDIHFYFKFYINPLSYIYYYVVYDVESLNINKLLYLIDFSSKLHKFKDIHIDSILNEVRNYLQTHKPKEIINPNLQHLNIMVCAAYYYNKNKKELGRYRYANENYYWR